MRGTQKVAMAAGLAVAAIGGWTLVGASPASARTEDQPGHGTPSQAHPGQPVPRTGAPGNTRPAQAPATGNAHEPASHGQPSSGGHGAPASGHTDAHAAPASTTEGEDDHAPGAAAGHESDPAAPTQDELVPTYFGETPDADTALAILTDGNQRWVTGHTQNPSSDESARRETAEHGQHPFATILTCADSRIPVERVFDRGVGELFVIRVAGNVVAETEAGTIEYGVGHLHTPVVVVMGHTGCGAVKAAVEGAETHGNVRFLIGEIEPAVRRAATVHPSAEGEELVNAAVHENVMQSMFDLLATSESLRSAVDNGTVRLVGAVYDIRTGEVEWIGAHPWQDGLISVLNSRAPASVREQATAEATGGRDDH